MKREIKFRAWDKSDKVMREVYGLLYPKISNHGNRDKFMVNMHCSDYEKQKAIILSDFERPLEEIELMQYTGLKDKNGKEIYEGDIVKETFGHTGQVVFQYGAFLLADKKGKIVELGEWQDSVVSSVVCEIVGNIYENPKILTNK